MVEHVLDGGDGPRQGGVSPPGSSPAPEVLLRPEAALVVHLRRALDPVAEIDVGQAHLPRAGDVVEDHEGAEAAVGIVGVEERIDHRQAVAEDVGERRRDQRAFAAAGDGGVGAAEAILEDIGRRRGIRRPSWRSRAPTCRPCRPRHGGRRDSAGRASTAREDGLAVVAGADEVAVALERPGACSASWRRRRPRCGPRCRPGSPRRPGGRRCSGCAGSRPG